MTSDTALRAAPHNYADAKNRHDVEAIVSACAPDGRYQDSAVRQPITGRARLRVFYTAFFESVPDHRGQFERRRLLRHPDPAPAAGRDRENRRPTPPGTVAVFDTQALRPGRR